MDKLDKTVIRGGLERDNNEDAEDDNSQGSTSGSRSRFHSIFVSESYAT